MVGPVSLIVFSDPKYLDMADRVNEARNLGLTLPSTIAALKERQSKLGREIAKSVSRKTRLVAITVPIGLSLASFFCAQVYVSQNDIHGGRVSASFLIRVILAPFVAYTGLYVRARCSRKSRELELRDADRWLAELLQLALTQQPRHRRHVLDN